MGCSKWTDVSKIVNGGDWCTLGDLVQKNQRVVFLDDEINRGGDILSSWYQTRDPSGYQVAQNVLKWTRNLSRTKNNKSRQFKKLGYNRPPENTLTWAQCQSTCSETFFGRMH